MCGFLAAFGPSLNLHRARLCELGNLLRHRGPDSSQSTSGDEYLFLFHRLAIQDPNPRSDQPMSDGTGRYTLVFNGELFNYLELREELMTRGTSFRTTSDSEVLLNGLIAHGKAFLSRIDGMYSFVFWDSQEKSLLIARDPFGIKPLYYIFSNGLLLIASEPRPLRQFASDTVCPLQLAELLVFRHTPFASSPFQKVKSLAGGHCLVGSLEQLREDIFTDTLDLLEQSSNTDPALDVESIREALFRSFQLHTRSDVGYALQLSGGVDSSLVAVFCAAEKKQKLSSYGIFLPDCVYDESQYRASVVDRYQLDHFEIEITGIDYADALLEAITALDAPTPHYGCVALFLLCREVSKKHKVLLTGEGADELFGGYSRYTRLSEYTSVKPSDDKELRAELPQNSVLFASAYTDPTEIKKLFPDLNYNFVARADIAARFPDISRQMMSLDHQCYLPSLLMRQDRVAMAHGVEARVPYVDIALARSVARIPLDRRLSPTRTKPLLKNIAYHYLDHQLIDRRKNGLLLPLRSWLKDEKSLGRYVSALTEPSARLAAYTDRRRMRSFVEEQVHQSGSETTPALMQVLNVELWLRSLDIVPSL